jgi:Domain of unknown function (DUF6916)
MPVSRRKLLQNSVWAMAACAANPFSAWAGRTQNGTPSSPGAKVDNAGLQALNRPAFAGEVGSPFQVTPTSGKASPVWLRLLAVEDLPALVPVNTASMAVPPKHSSAAPVRTKGFMLVFLGTMPKPLPQGTYNFEHSVLGTFSLLMVPDGPGKQTYTAVINRL